MLLIVIHIYVIIQTEIIYEVKIMEEITPAMLTDKGICPTCYDKEKIAKIREVLKDNMIQIRKENTNDYDEIYKVIKTAFATAENSDGNEQDLVVALRNSDNFIPELSLVAIDNDKIVGYILFTKVEIGKNTELALAPIGILPEYQRKGIGSKLIQEGHKIAKELGYHYVVVLGSEKYYPKFGYIPAIEYGIKPPSEIASENFMAVKLNNINTEIKGIVKYAKEFGL